MKRNTIAKLLTLLFVIGCHITMAQDDAQRQKHFNSEKGLMLSGYDPVSYFSGKPVKGKSSFQFKYKSSTYQFHHKLTLINSNQILLCTSLPTEAGVPMPWALK